MAVASFVRPANSPLAVSAPDLIISVLIDKRCDIRVWRECGLIIQVMSSRDRVGTTGASMLMIFAQVLLRVGIRLMD